MNRRKFTAISLGLLSATALGPSMSAAKPIRTRVIPSSGEEIPIIGLGTNRYGVNGSQESLAPLRAALQRFHELGGTLIDTAPQYRTSESVLGTLIDELGIQKDVFLATKTDKAIAEETAHQMLSSSRKLKASTIDLMQVHNLKGWKTALPVMQEWKKEGQVRYIGISTSRAQQYEEFESVMRSVPLDFIQINYSLAQRQAAERILPLAADLGIAVIINRAFGGGRVFTKLENTPLPGWATDFDCQSWAQFLLKFAISHPAATVAIPGMTKAPHVDDNIGAAFGRLPDADERIQQAAFYDAL